MIFIRFFVNINIYLLWLAIIFTIYLNFFPYLYGEFEITFFSYVIINWKLFIKIISTCNSFVKNVKNCFEIKWLNILLYIVLNVIQ